jgi:hypothetical protein
MQLIIRHFSLVILCGCIALMMTACGPSQPASEKQAPLQVHGEPINVAQGTPHQTNQPAVAVANVQPVGAQPSSSTSASASTPAVVTDAPKVPEVKATSDDDAYQAVGFDKLASYNFEVLEEAPVTNQVATADKADNQIPATVKAFDLKKVSIRGFMLPLKVENGKVTEFLIMKDQSMCCYGATPKINEWVSVKLSGRGIKPIMDQPVSMLGTLHVGAMRENGYLVGIYQMDGDKLIDTGDN